MSSVRPLGPSSEHTRSAILDLVRSSGTVSRIELAEMSGLTAASITRIIKSLIDAGLVVESGQADSTGGKRRSLLELNPHARYAVGLSLDDARLTYVLADLGGAVIGRFQSAGIGQIPPRRVIPRIARELRAFLQQRGVPEQDVVGVGVAGAGLDLSADAERLSTSAEEWESFPVQEELEAALGLPVVHANDAACAALGEFWAGRIPATQDFATLYMAAGFGLGLMVGGQLLRGASSNVGEIGHMVVQVDGPGCWCGSRGCLEMLAAPRAVVAAAMRHPDLVQDLELSGDDSHLRHDFVAVARAAMAGRPVCLEIVERSAALLAAAVLSVVNLLDLDRIHLAGPGFVEAGALYARAIRDALERTARTRTVHHVVVELSDPEFDAAAVGAASLALQHVLTPHTRPATAREPAQA